MQRASTNFTKLQFALSFFRIASYDDTCWRIPCERRPLLRASVKTVRFSCAFQPQLAASWTNRAPCAPHQPGLCSMATPPSASYRGMLGHFRIFPGTQLIPCMFLSFSGLFRLSPLFPAPDILSHSCSLSCSCHFRIFPLRPNHLTIVPVGGPVRHGCNVPQFPVFFNFPFSSLRPRLAYGTRITTPPSSMVTLHQAAQTALGCKLGLWLGSALPGREGALWPWSICEVLTSACFDGSLAFVQTTSSLRSRVPHWRMYPTKKNQSAST